MALPNQKEEAPFAHYLEKFHRLDPWEVNARLKDISWDGEKFYVNFLARKVAISHPDGAFWPEDLPRTARTFLLRYLLEGRDVVWLGTFKTFRELPWGEVYQSAFAGRILGRAARSFGNCPDRVRAAAEKLGAASVGENGWEFVLLGNCKMRLILWEGDEEFPPSAQILYSDNFGPGFTAEDRVVAAELLLNAIQERAK